MKRKPCVYKNIAAEMLMQDIDIATMAKRTYIDYKSMCKKLNGDSKITIEEAISIFEVLHRALPVEKLFERQ